MSDARAKTRSIRSHIRELLSCLVRPVSGMRRLGSAWLISHKGVEGRRIAVQLSRFQDQGRLRAPLARVRTGAQRHAQKHVPLTVGGRLELEVTLIGMPLLAAQPATP